MRLMVSAARWASRTICSSAVFTSARSGGLPASQCVPALPCATIAASGWVEALTINGKSWPFTERFSMFVKLGLASTKAEFEGTSVTGGVPTQFTVDERRNSLLAGFGAQYNITRNIGIRGEFENWGEVGNNKQFPLDTTRTGKAKMATWNLLGVFSF